MKKLFFMVIVCLLITGCSKVPAGYVGVKVNLLGSSKGVNVEELSVGRYFIGMNEELYLFPTFTQNYVWTKNINEGSPIDESIKFQTIEGMEVSCDVGISYAIDPTKVSNIFQKYRKGIDEITDIYLRNTVRDAFVLSGEDKEIQFVYGKGKSELLSEVKSRVVEKVGHIGINVDNIYLVNSFRLPPQIVKSINAKMEATQKAQKRENEIRTAKAEAEKKIAEADGKAKSKLKIAKAEAKSILIKAESQAKANIILAKSITPELIRYKNIEKWDGKLPRFTGSNAIPMLNLSNIK